MPVGSDGTFTLDNVPSPNVYQLVVVKTGYATTIQRLDVAGGEQRTGVQLTLRKGDGRDQRASSPMPPARWRTSR